LEQAASSVIRIAAQTRRIADWAIEGMSRKMGCFCAIIAYRNVIARVAEVMIC